MNYKISLVAVLLFSTQIKAQTFSDLHSGLPALQSSCAAWADYDNDGDQDLVLEGFSSIFAERGFIFRNVNGTMIAVDSSIIKISNGSVNWGDYDNDGDDDLLINGQHNGTGLTQLYRNDSNSVFTPVTTGIVGLIGIQRWIDIDNDGWKDIIACGDTEPNLTRSTSIYRNNGNGTFSSFLTNLPPLEANDIEVADYNNDSLPDFFVTGNIGQQPAPFTGIFQNNGNGNFTMDTSSFRQMWTGTGKWGDVDNDGDLDILYDGIIPDNTAYSLIYLNDGSGIFSEQINNLPGTGEPGFVDWADIDHDGDLDVALGGGYLLRNDSNGIFTDISPWAPGFISLPIIFTDFDNDGDQDIFAVNYFGNNESTIYRNDPITKVNENKSYDSNLIYPNPVADLMSIKNSFPNEVNVHITDVNGKLIREIILLPFQNEINIPDLTAGVYFMEIKINDMKHKMRFIKM